MPVERKEKECEWFFVASKSPAIMSSSSGLTAPLPFYKLMALEATELPLKMRSDALATFKSIARAWAPGMGSTAFGGHVYAQAAWAASKTVVEGMIIHVCQ